MRHKASSTRVYLLTADRRSLSATQERGPHTVRSAMCCFCCPVATIEHRTTKEALHLVLRDALLPLLWRPHGIRTAQPQLPRMELPSHLSPAAQSWIALQSRGALSRIELRLHCNDHSRAFSAQFA
eukprot:1157871-Pelagomonas_calceolata.AAC.6